MRKVKATRTNRLFFIEYWKKSLRFYSRQISIGIVLDQALGRFVYVHSVFLQLIEKMDAGAAQPGQTQVRDEIGIKCQILFQDFLEE